MSAGLAAGTAALAADYDMKGHLDSQASHQIEAFDDGTVLILASMQQEIRVQAEAHPMHGARGPCKGTILVAADGVGGEGHCYFEDSTGDRFVIRWHTQRMNEQGGPVGTWHMVTGSGKYASASASGSYDDVPTDAAGASNVYLEGRLSLPD